ncbi:MAG: 30S ribosomal protein S5 [bacterium]
MVVEEQAKNSSLDFLNEKRELIISEPIENWTEKVVHINRCAKVVKGGRRFSFSVLIVAGNKAGLIGLGMGKAKEVSDAIRKASENAKKRVFKISLLNNTIPHVALGESGGGRVILKPACPGTGIIAGGGIRAVLEMAGVKDVLSKSLGANNNLSMVRSTINALLQLRTKKQINALRAAEGDLVA